MRPLLIVAAAAMCGFAQNLSVGVIAGTNLTRGFEATTTPIGGAMVEWSLPRSLSLEGDAVWHSYPLGHQLGTEITWEIPVLVKYKFPLPFCKPFLEAGPSFRTAETHAGISAGAGVEFHVLRHLAIAPELRYTHWESRYEGLNPNQVEFLTAFSFTSAENTRPLGPHVSFGMVLGSTVTDDFRSLSQTGPVVYGDSPAFVATSVTTGQSALLIGPSLEIQLPLDLAVEIEAIRRPLPELTLWTVAHGTVLTSSQSAALNALAAASQGATDITWDFPVLAKYTLLLSRIEPLVEFGASFRLPQEVNGGHLSTHGITGGVGIEVHLLRVRVAPQLRYTRWASDSPAGSTRFRSDQLEFLTAFVF